MPYCVVNLLGQTPAAKVLRSFQRSPAHLPVGIIPVTTTMARAAPGTSACTLTRWHRSASLLFQTSFSTFCNNKINSNIPGPLGQYAWIASSCYDVMVGENCLMWGQAVEDSWDECSGSILDRWLPCLLHSFILVCSSPITHRRKQNSWFFFLCQQVAFLLAWHSPFIYESVKLLLLLLLLFNNGYI